MKLNSWPDYSEEEITSVINVLKSGSFSVSNANNFETPILGNLSEIQYLYKRTHFQNE